MNKYPYKKQWIASRKKSSNKKMRMMRIERINPFNHLYDNDICISFIVF